MILKFKTNPDINGNTRFIAIDTDKKQFARCSREIYPDAVIVSKSAIIAIKMQCYAADFTEVENM